MNLFTMIFLLLVVAGVLLLALHSPTRRTPTAPHPESVTPAAADDIVDAMLHAVADAVTIGTGYIRVDHRSGQLSWQVVDPTSVTITT